MTPRKPKTAIVPRTLLGAVLTTAVPACALGLANACSSDEPRTDYTFVADVSSHFDQIFVADVSAHFDDAEPKADAPNDAGDEADAPDDAEDAG